MRYRSGICAIIFLRKEQKFLIFHRIKNWSGWEFLKGGIRAGETEEECLKRELEEETGSKKYKIIVRMPYEIKYSWTKEYVKDHHKWIGTSNRLYLIEFFDRRIKIDKEEHDGFRWVKNPEKYLTYDNLKVAFKYFVKQFPDIFSA